MSAPTLRQKHMKKALSMLSLGNEWQADWKLIIHDSIGHDILRPMMSLDKLRSNNVTLHLSIDCHRDPIPDVSAIYFVMPSEKNIDLICRDMENHLYDSYYFNFISSVPRSDLEKIAKAAMSSDSAANVRKVYDRHLNFIALEDNLFILRENAKQLISFFALNKSVATESDINDSIDCIVDGLYSVLVTYGMLPIIRCPEGGPSEIVAKRLHSKIRDSLNNSQSMELNKIKTRKRPLLCIVDRIFDMSTPLHHAWTYQALVHDTLDSELNKIQVVEEDVKTGKPKTQFYELDPDDNFWNDQKGKPFPQVADAIQQNIDDCKKREEEINILRNSADSDQSCDMSFDSNSKLSSATSSIPELAENKRILKKHTTIASAVLEEIKKRKLDNFFEIEEKIMNRSVIDRVNFDEMLANPENGRPSDKYRLFLISYICDNPKLSSDEAEKYVNLLEEQGCQRSAFDYLKQWKAISTTNVAQLQSSLQASGGVLKTAGMFTKLMSKGSKLVMEGVKNLVLKEHHLPLTKLVEGLLDTESKKSKESLQYLYLDPKTDGDSQHKQTTFQEAIVFVVGGGNYVEYQNLVDFCGTKNSGTFDINQPPNVIYGSTDLMTADQFLRHLGRLGSLI